MMDPNRILNKLLEAFSFTFVKHWQTSSYAEHMALGKFYGTLYEQIDSFAEKSMAQNREIIQMPKALIFPDTDVRSYLSDLHDYVSAQIIRYENELTLQDELIGINQTIKQTLNDLTRS